MDKNTNVHTKVGATFVSVYYNALADGKIADVTKMYLPNAKVSHFNTEGASAALAAYAKGARFNITSVETTLAANDNTRVKVSVKGSVTIIGDKKKDFQHDIDLLHHGTNASQFSIGVSSDVLRASAVPPPPKMKFDDWAADTPQLAAQAEAEADVPSIELVASKDVTPQVTPKVAPKAAAPVEEKKVEEAPVVAAAPVAVEEKKAPAKTEEKKVEEEKPAAPKGWANIVRADKTVAKAVVSVIDPTKKVEKKEEKTEEKEKPEKKERKSEKKSQNKTEGEEESKGEEKEKSEKKNERRSNKGSGPIFYDVFIKGFPEGTTDADIRAALVTKVAIANTKIDTKEDKSGVKRVFVYVKLSAEDLTKQGVTREEAIAAIVTANKSAKHNGSRLSVEEVKERFNADGVSTKAAAKK